MGLTDDELVVACRNIGFDLTCGACAGTFFTGAGMGEHTCQPTPTSFPQQHVDAAERFVSSLRKELISSTTPEKRRPVVRAALGAACIMRDLLVDGRTAITIEAADADS